MKPLGLGIIGLHHQHPKWYYPLWEHLPAYRPLVIAERDRAFLDNEAAFYGLDTTTDYHTVLNRGDIDVVIVFLPHLEMPGAVGDALAAGKHVIVEKPACANIAGMNRIAAASNAHPTGLVSAPYCWRNHRASAVIKQTIERGGIGEIRALEARLNAGSAQRYIRDKCEWILSRAQGGGPMWNLGVHWIDYFRWITGQEIVAVSGATTGPDGGPARDIEDNAQAVVTFGNGASGILDISYSLQPSYPGGRDIYFSVRGTRGSISWSPAWKGVHDTVQIVGSGNADESCRVVEITSEDIPGYGGEMGWSWLDRFAAAMRGECEPDVTLRDMRSAVHVADAFYRSCESGRREAVAPVD